MKPLLLLSLFVGGLFVFQIPLQAWAGMGWGSHGGGGGMGTGEMSDGMGYGQRFGHADGQPDFGQQQGSGKMMDRGMATNVAQTYLMRKYGNSHHLGEIEDHDPYFSAEILGPRGRVTEWLLINKQNGHTHSLKP